ncbi:hypothetical protein TWF191_003064 [Orbilia oligospora]|uniref:Uncharacterized protein n=1 Tax=Orbilia oligospora TaxID=2813651 RepID=A0A7C8QZB7_ORBOL|nr:hypothetical protein TWF191_003064 [Orbilia oligospora]
MKQSTLALFHLLVFLGGFSSCRIWNIHQDQETQKRELSSSRPTHNIKDQNGETAFGYQAAQDKASPEPGLSLKNVTRSLRFKRAGGDSDVIMIDDDGIDLDILPNLNPQEKELVRESYKTGADLLSKGEEGLQNPVHKDPDLDWHKLDKSVVIRRNIRGLPQSVIKIFKDLGQEFLAEDVGTYTAVFRSVLKDDGTADYDSTVLRTYISREYGHMFFPWPGELPAGAQYHDWIYQCWVRGSHDVTDGLHSDIPHPLKYITIGGITGEETLAILQAVGKEWIGRDLSQDESVIFITREDIDLSLAKSSPKSVSYFIFTLFNILSGTREISPTIKMLSTFPNEFDWHRISAIGFSVEDDGTANLLLKLEPSTESQYAEVDPAKYRVVLQPLGLALQMGGSSSLIKHPAQPDIQRTSYGWQDGESNDPGSTFFRSAVQYEDVSYRFAISGREKHIVFEGFLTGAAAAPVLQDYVEKEVDKEMHHVLYSAWLGTAGQVSLLEITFASIHPQSRNKIKEIKDKQRPAGITAAEWDRRIAVFEDLQRDFNEVLQIFVETREGRVLDKLIRKYGDNLAISKISRLEVGIYTAPGFKKRKGKPFILVGFRRLLKTDLQKGLRVELSGSEDDPVDPSTQSWKSDIPNWLFLSDSPESTQELSIQTIQLGVYANSVAEIEARFPGMQPFSRAYSSESLALLVSRYIFEYQKDTSPPESVKNQCAYLLNSQEIGATMYRDDPKESRYRNLRDFVSKKTQTQLRYLAEKNRQSSYDQVTVRSSPAVGGNTNKGDIASYGLVLNLDLGFVIVTLRPKTIDGHVMELENAVYAAWHSLYTTSDYDYRNPRDRELGSAVSWLDLQHACSHGPRYFFIHDISYPTRLIIEEIYKRRSMQKSEVLILSEPNILSQGISRYSAYRRLGKHSNTRSDLEYMQDLFAVLGSPDLIGISRLATKYFGTKHMFCRTAVKHIVVTWSSSPDFEESRPELFVSLRELTHFAALKNAQATWESKGVNIRRLIEPAILGRTTSILETLYIQAPKNADSGFKENLWDVLELDPIARCPTRSIQLFDSSQLRESSSVLGQWRDKTEHEPHIQFNVKSRIKDINYRFLIYQKRSGKGSSRLLSGSAGYGHLIGQAFPIVAGLENQAAEELSEAYLRAWGAGLQKFPPTAGKNLLPSLVTFLGLTPETQSIIKLLWSALVPTQGTSGEHLDLKIRVTIRYRVDKLAGTENTESDKFWQNRSGHFHRLAFEVLMGLPEILGLSHSLRGYDGNTGRDQRRIQTVYCESSTDDSGGIQCILRVARTRPPTQDGGADID